MRCLIRTLLGMGLFAFCWMAVGYGIRSQSQVRPMVAPMADIASRLAARGRRAGAGLVVWSVAYTAVVIAVGVVGFTRRDL